MKKILLLIVMSLALSGCSSATNTPVKEKEPVVVATEEQAKEAEDATTEVEPEQDVTENPEMTQEDADIISSVIYDWTYGMYEDTTMTYTYETLSKGPRLVVMIEAQPEDIGTIYSEIWPNAITTIDELSNAIKSDVTFETIFNDLVERGTLSQDIWGIKVNYSDPEDGVYAFVAFPSLF